MGMPCLVSQSKNGANSPMTPPTSPQNRSRNQNSGGIRKNSHQNHHSTNKSGGDSDILSDSIVTRRTHKNNVRRLRDGGRKPKPLIRDIPYGEVLRKEDVPEQPQRDACYVHPLVGCHA